MNNLDEVWKRVRKSQNLDFGRTALHAWIRCFEAFLHISYRLNVQKWQIRVWISLLSDLLIGDFYEQTDGVAMERPLRPVIVNLFIGHFQQKAINSFDHKPTVWFRYMDDTFVAWNHGQKMLNQFLDHLNA